MGTRAKHTSQHHADHEGCKAARAEGPEANNAPLRERPGPRGGQEAWDLRTKNNVLLAYRLSDACISSVGRKGGRNVVKGRNAPTLVRPFHDLGQRLLLVRHVSVRAEEIRHVHGSILIKVVEGDQSEPGPVAVGGGRHGHVLRVRDVVGPTRDPEDQILSHNVLLVQ
eukprot:scaffold3408_cov651-Pavlova_lutheri.AAC.1